MSLIQLPPGMTPEQYWASPQGQQTAARQKQLRDEMAQGQYAAPSPAAPPRPGRRPVSAPSRPAPEYPTRRSWPPPPPVPGIEYGPGPDPYVSPGQAQPKVDPAATATRPRDAARNEIAAALKEMFPELSPGQIQKLSQELADEYRRERTAAVDALRPARPGMAEPVY
jgi:hypothetical protein